MIPLSLPLEERRAQLRSFWFLCGTGIGAGLWLVGWLLGRLADTRILFVSEACLWSVGLVELGLVLRCYRAWNRVVVHPFVRVATAATLNVCFLIISAAGKGTRLRMTGHGSTAWQRRSTLRRDEYALPFAVQGEAAGGGWMRSYVVWAARTGNLWSISLVPLLALLSLLSSEQRRTMQTNIYTLF